MREFVSEAAAIGALGGAGGIAVAFALVAFIDARSAAQGNLELFAITPRLGFGAFGFAVALSIVGPPAGDSCRPPRSDRRPTAKRMMEPLITVRNLVKIHAPGTAAEVRALDGIDFTIQRGAFVAIVGESGSGKTTLMHILGALDRASSGEVVLAGHALERASRRELQRIRAREIGFVFQGFNLIATLDALENVVLAAHYARQEPSAARSAALQLLADVGLTARAHHHPAQLSGGQQQRVAIARALVNEPALLLADEPTGELDSRTAEAVLDLFKRFNRERGQTIVLVTHNPAVWQRCDTVITLADGKIVDLTQRTRAATPGSVAAR